MKHDKTLARPYAKAVFEFALASKKLDEWSKNLAFLSEIAGHKSLQALYGDPAISAEQLSSVFTKAVPNNEHLKNFILLLSHYDRLALLPEIAELFEEAKANYEKTSTVYVTSAFPMEESVQKKLKSSLEIRLQRDVIMDFAIDKDLLGGAIIRAGDWVVDGSVRAKLEKLKQEVVA